MNSLISIKNSKQINILETFKNGNRVFVIMELEIYTQNCNIL